MSVNTKDTRRRDGDRNRKVPMHVKIPRWVRDEIDKIAENSPSLAGNASLYLRELVKADFVKRGLWRE